MSGPSPSPDSLQLLRTPCLITLLFTCGVSIGVPCLTFCYNTLNDRKLANEVRRSARAEEMKVLMARLDRFYANSKSGEVMGREGIEGKRGCSGNGCALWRIMRWPMTRGGRWW